MEVGACSPRGEGRAGEVVLQGISAGILHPQGVELGSHGSGVCETPCTGCPAPEHPVPPLFLRNKPSLCVLPAQRLPAGNATAAGDLGDICPAWRAAEPDQSSPEQGRCGATSKKACFPTRAGWCGAQGVTFSAWRAPMQCDPLSALRQGLLAFGLCRRPGCCIPPPDQKTAGKPHRMPTKAGCSLCHVASDASI